MIKIIRKSTENNWNKGDLFEYNKCLYMIVNDRSGNYCIVDFNTSEIRYDFHEVNELMDCFQDAKKVTGVLNIE